MNPSLHLKPIEAGCGFATRRTSHSSRRCRSGQALVEFAIFLVGLLVLVFGLVDFARLFSTQQVLINLSREGANLASRGTELVDAVNAMAASATPLNIDRDGYVIITVVQRDSGNRLTIVAQQARGGRSFNSRVGSILNPTAVNMPSSEIPQRNQTATIAEVFYVFRSATPVGRLTGIVMPTSLYDIAYF